MAQLRIFSLVLVCSLLAPAPAARAGLSDLPKLSIFAAIIYILTQTAKNAADGFAQEVAKNEDPATKAQRAQSFQKWTDKYNQLAPIVAQHFELPGTVGEAQYKYEQLVDQYNKIVGAHQKTEELGNKIAAIEARKPADKNSFIAMLPQRVCHALSHIAAAAFGGFVGHSVADQALKVYGGSSKAVLTNLTKLNALRDKMAELEAAGATKEAQQCAAEIEEIQKKLQQNDADNADQPTWQTATKLGGALVGAVSGLCIAHKLMPPIKPHEDTPLEKERKMAWQKEYDEVKNNKDVAEKQCEQYKRDTKFPLAAVSAYGKLLKCMEKIEACKNPWNEQLKAIFQQNQPIEQHA